MTLQVPRAPCAIPGIVPIKLRSTGALISLKFGELMAATALLAEALHLALAHECWEPDVDIADAVPEVVCAQLTDITSAILNLQGCLAAQFSAANGISSPCK